MACRGPLGSWAPGQDLSTSREETYLHNWVPCSFCTETGISEAGGLHLSLGPHPNPFLCPQGPAAHSEGWHRRAGSSLDLLSAVTGRCLGH